MANPPAFLGYEIGEGGRILNIHQTTLLRFRSAQDLVWNGGLSVPVFWASLFSQDLVTATGAAVAWDVGLRNLERRQAAWKAKSSPLLFRGFPRFVEWVSQVGGGSITLDVSGIDDWRHEPLLAAVTSLIRFLDDESATPGLLLAGDEVVGWTKRKKGVQLESRRVDLHWPDEAPMFSPRTHELTAATVGLPPFRRGPWPEHRFAEDELAPLSPELDAATKERSRSVSRALEHRPDRVALPRSIGNLEGIERMRLLYRSSYADFQREASQLAQSAKKFANAHQVFDDAELWNDMLAAAEQRMMDAEAELTKQELEVKKAMTAADALPRDPAREFNLDEFPSGDDPF